MTSDVLSRPTPPPDLELRYGTGEDRVADLWLPARRGPRAAPAPLVLFLHGGFWRVAYGRSHTRPLARALSAAGFAVCVPEFRRAGQPGGGWPGTFDDTAAAVDRLPALVGRAVGSPRIGTRRVLLAGHSAGGHLSLWAAARRQLPPGTPWRAGGDHVGVRTVEPAAAGRSGSVGRGAEIGGVVALAAVSDLAGCYHQGLGQDAATALMGGGPQDYPERYRVADPARMLPLRCPVRLVHGSLDDRVPCAMSRDYVKNARSAGGDAVLDELPDAGHFDVIDPLSGPWPRVLAAFISLVPAGPAAGG